MVPPVLTCLIGRNLGTGTGSLDHYDLRDLAASLLGHLCHKYSKYSHNLKPRLARSCLKTYLDPKKPFGSHYGAILGLKAIGGAEVVRQLIVPNLKAYGELLEEELQESSTRRAEAEKVVAAILNALGTLVDDEVPMMNGHSDESADQLRGKLVDRLGAVIGGRIADSAHPQLAHAVLDEDLPSL
jgi:transcription initiation factor TFIID subunit 6